MENFNFDFFCTSCTKDQAYREANCITKAVVKRYKKGEYIVYRGDVASSILMVSEGKITNDTVLDSAISLISISHSAPYPLGAVALFAQNNHFRIDCRATEDCTVGIISRERIEEQISSCKIFMRNFIADNARKVDILSAHLSILSCPTLKAKIAFYLFSIAKNQKFEFDRTLSEIATYFCVERPSLSRTLNLLKREGIISYSRGKGEILRSAALRELLDK